METNGVQMRQVSCRKCHTPQMIKGRLQQEAEYPDDVICYECWKPKEKSKSSVKVKTSKSGTWSSSGHKNYSSQKNWTVDQESGLEVACKYEVGDSVFIHSDEYGVLLVQILDTEAWGIENIFYTLDVKGTVVDFIDEDDLFDTATEAAASPAVRYQGT